jgi:hypothetical protein
MTLSQKLEDVYVKYLLNDRDVSKTLGVVKVTRPTLLKYLKIYEKLDPELRVEMDRKKNKLTMTMAIYLCDNVLHPSMQCEIYPQIKFLKTPDKKQKIAELCECILCADTRVAFEEMPCCGTIMCEACVMRVYDEAIDGICYKAVRCPFCSQCFTLKEARDFLVTKFKLHSYVRYRDDWRNHRKYRDNLSSNPTYSLNLYNKFTNIISAIEDSQRKPRRERLRNQTRDFSSVGKDDTYYGACTSCTPAVSSRIRIDWGHIEMCEVEKQCAQGDGELAVLDPGMFLCTVCKSHQEPDDATFKKCPHCGIKTLKPDGCNYVVCGDHRWCWICNERLEVNHDGHNTHYFTGLPGASPYANECRVSLKQNKPLFTMSQCECASCAPFGGAPLCKTLECMHRAQWRRQGRSHDFQLTREYCGECHSTRRNGTGDRIRWW